MLRWNHGIHNCHQDCQVHSNHNLPSSNSTNSIPIGSNHPYLSGWKNCLLSNNLHDSMFWRYSYGLLCTEPWIILAWLNWRRLFGWCRYWTFWLQNWHNSRPNSRGNVLAGWCDHEKTKGASLQHYSVLSWGCWRHCKFDLADHWAVKTAWQAFVPIQLTILA